LLLQLIIVLNEIVEIVVVLLNLSLVIDEVANRGASLTVGITYAQILTRRWMFVEHVVDLTAISAIEEFISSIHFLEAIGVRGPLGIIINS
jgi:hypothetical protein